MTPRLKALKLLMVLDQLDRPQLMEIHGWDPSDTIVTGRWTTASMRRSIRTRCQIVLRRNEPLPHIDDWIDVHYRCLQALMKSSQPLQPLQCP